MSRLAVAVLLTGCSIPAPISFDEIPSPPAAPVLIDGASLEGDPACEPPLPTFAHVSAVAALGRPPLAAEREAWLQLSDRNEVVDAILESDTAAFAERWAEVFLDGFRIPRTHDRERPTMRPCFGEGAAEASPEVAAWVVEHGPDASFSTPFTYYDLLRSSLLLDDLSPALRALPLAQQAFPLWPANAVGEERERLRRSDFGDRFFGLMLRRPLACLRCHNSERSVTASPDPTRNRHFPLPVPFEQLLFEAASGPAEPAAALAVFRYDGFVDPGTAPWGWSPRCGQFRASPSYDPVAVEARLAGVEGELTALDLEAGLHQGFESLRGRNAETLLEIFSPPSAMAMLVAGSFVEVVFRELTGGQLTAPHGFPVTEDQRSTLLALLEVFISTGYSTRALVRTILVSDLWSSSTYCDAAEPVARVFRTGRNDGDNQRSDSLRHRSARQLLRDLHHSLEWPLPDDFVFPHQAPTRELLLSSGAFMRMSRPGFRGLDLSAALDWEARFGFCAPPEGGDWISRLAGLQGREELHFADAALALELQLLGQPASSRDDLRLEAEETLEDGLRRHCGTLTMSPEFLLEGRIAPPAEVNTAAARALLRDLDAR